MWLGFSSVSAFIFSIKSFVRETAIGASIDSLHFICFDVSSGVLNLLCVSFSLNSFQNVSLIGCLLTTATIFSPHYLEYIAQHYGKKYDHLQKDMAATM